MHWSYFYFLINWVIIFILHATVPYFSQYTQTDTHKQTHIQRDIHTHYLSHTHAHTHAHKLTHTHSAMEWRASGAMDGFWLLILTAVNTCMMAILVAAVVWNAYRSDVNGRQTLQKLDNMNTSWAETGRQTLQKLDNMITSLAFLKAAAAPLPASSVSEYHMYQIVTSTKFYFHKLPPNSLPLVIPLSRLRIHRHETESHRTAAAWLTAQCNGLEVVFTKASRRFEVSSPGNLRVHGLTDMVAAPHPVPANATGIHLPGEAPLAPAEVDVRWFVRNQVGGICEMKAFGKLNEAAVHQFLLQLVALAKILAGVDLDGSPLPGGINAHPPAAFGVLTDTASFAISATARYDHARKRFNLIIYNHDSNCNINDPRDAVGRALRVGPNDQLLSTFNYNASNYTFDRRAIARELTRAAGAAVAAAAAARQARQLGRVRDLIWPAFPEQRGRRVPPPTLHPRPQA